MTPHKLFSLLKFRFLHSLYFRSEIFIWIILDFLPFFVILFIFQSMYQSTGNIRGLTLDQVLQYYFFAAIVQGVTSIHFEPWRSEEIRNGKIDFYLTRPFSYLSEIFLSDVAGKLFYLCLFFPFYALFIWLINQQFGIFILVNITLIKFIPFLGLLIAAYILQSLIGMVIVLLTFWFEGAEGLQHFKMFSLTILSGTMLPLEFSPIWLQKMIGFLPIKYMFLVPISILQGKYSLQLIDVMSFGGTIICLYLLCQFLLNSGRRRYGSYGG